MIKFPPAGESHWSGAPVPGVLCGLGNRTWG